MVSAVERESRLTSVWIVECIYINSPYKEFSNHGIFSLGVLGECMVPQKMFGKWFNMELFLNQMYSLHMYKM